MKKSNKIGETAAPVLAKELQIVGKPFVKWVGGKSSLSNVIMHNLPQQYNNYYEPFVGGGAVFFKLQPQNAFLSDINLDLVITYNVVKKKVSELIEKLQVYKENHNKEHYLMIRALDNIDDALTVASRFIYLNKTCFNGLYRVNKNGQFNVPMGSYDNPLIVDRETLENDAMILHNATIEYKQFNAINPFKKDFIYFDPPYDETYNSYDSTMFGFEKQKELAKFCKKLHKKGCYFMVSNSDTQNIRKLYKNFIIMEVHNMRSVNCKGTGRGKIKELLIKNYE